METKKIVTNTFNKGLVTDTQPLLTPDDVLTDCINGTILTRHGNEYTLQHDLGNTELDGVTLPDGYKPIASTVHNNIWYIVSTNGERVEIGSFPSPATIYARDIEEGVETQLYNWTTGMHNKESELQLYSGFLTINKYNYFAISLEDLPEYLYAEFLNTSTNGLISPIEDVNNVHTYYENTSKDIQIKWVCKLNKIDVKVEHELYKSNGNIYGDITITLTSTKPFVTNKLLCVITDVSDYGEYDLISEEIIDNSVVYKYSISGQAPLGDLSLRIQPQVSSDENVIFYYDPIKYTVTESNIQEDVIKIFDTWNWVVNDSDVDVQFYARRYGTELGVLKYTLYGLTIESDAIVYQPLLENIEITHDDDYIYSTKIDFSNDVKKNQVYIFHVDVEDESHERLLITSDLFNDVGADDFSQIYANDWVKNFKLNLPTIENAKLGDLEQNIVTNDTEIPYRKYITNVTLNDIAPVNETMDRNEFIAKYMPYIDSKVWNDHKDELHPTINLQRYKNITWVNDLYKATSDGIWEMLYGKHTITFSDDQGHSSRQTSGGDGVVNMYDNLVPAYLYCRTGVRLPLVEKNNIERELYEREYLTTELLELELSSGSTTDKNDGVIETINIKIGDESVIFLKMSNNDYKFNDLNFIYKFNTPNDEYFTSNSENPTVDENIEIESIGVDTAYNVPIPFLWNEYTEKVLFIPVKINGSVAASNYFIEADENTYCGVLCWTKQKNITDTTEQYAYLPIDISKLGTDETDAETRVKSICNDLNSRIYKIQQYESHDLIQFGFGKVEQWAEQFNSLTKLESQVDIYGFTIADTSNDKILLLLQDSDIPLNNITFQQSVQIKLSNSFKQTISDTDLDATNISGDLSNCESELTKFAESITDKTILFSDAMDKQTYYYDWSDMLYDTLWINQKNVKPPFDSIVGDYVPLKSISNKTISLDNSLYFHKTSAIDNTYTKASSLYRKIYNDTDEKSSVFGEYKSLFNIDYE